ncbi:hypothetical protein F8388_005867 [Cannabis sativa]|uniref:Uncharacterized protein n=1 Tax=Cannabis sativa TaxID=3483 RepID=A0A7J6HFY8_CANSA|nr:hypothetical protein F8388_005867 [Cannabis sativa]KAF4404531.1 hypothetical protein G4B88_005917 [Cannabis sativa]
MQVCKTNEKELVMEPALRWARNPNTSFKIKLLSLRLKIQATNLKQNINQMFGGEHINSTENRSVFHVALRARRDTVIQSDEKNENNCYLHY